MNKKSHEIATIVSRIMRESNKKNNFAVLGLTRGAKEADVKKAHRDLARQLHPDKISSLNIPNADVAYTRMTAAKDACLAKLAPKKVEDNLMPKW